MSSSLSYGEHFCLYRAFLRFEIYARVFRPAQTLFDLTAYDGQTQFQLFIRRFEPWEVEEITCVHQYLSTIIRCTLHEMDCEFEVEARRFEGLAGQISSTQENSLQKLKFGRLFNFSDDFRDQVIRRSSSIAASGLAYMLRFCRNNQLERFAALQKNHLTYSPFLCQALPIEADFGALARSSDYKDPMQASIGYVRHNAGPGGGYVGIEESDSNLCYRTLGCIFWDPDRLDSTLFQNAVLYADTMGSGILADVVLPALPKNGGYSLEYSLRDVHLPADCLRHLVNKFALIDYMENGTLLVDMQLGKHLD